MALSKFEKMNVMQLQAAKTEIEHLIARKAVEEREALTAHITEMVAARGFSLAEILGTRRVGKNGKTGKVAPKFRNPDNPAETWSGRGRQPRWLSPLIKRGAKLEKFLIK